MPIHERDPWRKQYFANLACPADVFIPTDDSDAYCWYARQRWIFNKLSIAESQCLECAPHGIEPSRYPVFSKPIYNLKGMGVGSALLRTPADYEARCQPGHFWMRYLEGDHVSSDFAVVAGKVRWSRHAVGLTGLAAGTFDYWIIEAEDREDLTGYCAAWIADHLKSYTGMINLETIGGRIIEAHLRFSDQWPDLYGAGWLEAMVHLYARHDWRYLDLDRRTGYSVALFAPHEGSYRHPDKAVIEEILATPGISSVQITFHEGMANDRHAMPPGGFRVAIVNASDLAAGLNARAALARQFGIDAADRVELPARKTKKAMSAKAAAIVTKQPIEPAVPSVHESARVLPRR